MQRRQRVTPGRTPEVRARREIEGRGMPAILLLANMQAGRIQTECTAHGGRFRDSEFHGFTAKVSKCHLDARYMKIHEIHEIQSERRGTDERVPGRETECVRELECF